MGRPVSSPITFTASGSVDGTNDLQGVLNAAATPLPDEPDWLQFADAEAHMGCVLFHFQTSTTNVTHQACLLRRLHHNFLKQFGQEVSFNITVMLSGCVMQIGKSKGSAPVVYTLSGVQRPVIISHCMESGKLIVTGACLDGTTFHAAQDQQPAVERLVVLESSKRTAEQNPGSCLSGQFLACTCIIGACRTQMLRVLCLATYVVSPCLQHSQVGSKHPSCAILYEVTKLT